MQIGKSREGRYLLLAGCLCLLFLAGVTYHEVRTVTADGVGETFIAIGRGFAPFVIISLAGSLLVLESVAMLAERYLRQRYREGRAEGKAEGIAEGIAEGKAEGKAEGMTEGMAQANKAWEDWNRRREEAERENREFNEPPPSRSDNNV